MPQPNRIDQTFADLRAQGRKAFIGYLTAGYPDLQTTVALAVGFKEAGVDILELGIPFSDPMADGATIQEASFEALQAGVTVKKIIEAVRIIRQSSDIPLALMTYYNPVLHYGIDTFVQEASRAGVDGLIIPDLPVDEAGQLVSAARKAAMATIFFLAPTTSKERMPAILKASTGFVYFVSVAGVTGSSTSVPADIARQISMARKFSDRPVCVGFGISTPEQVKAMAAISDGVIVGSAIIREIKSRIGQKSLVEAVTSCVKTLTRVLK